MTMRLRPGPDPGSIYSTLSWPQETTPGPTRLMRSLTTIDRGPARVRQWSGDGPPPLIGGPVVALMTTGRPCGTTQVVTCGTTNDWQLQPGRGGWPIKHERVPNARDPDGCQACVSTEVVVWRHRNNEAVGGRGKRHIIHIRSCIRVGG
ncbi:hypothetical protein Tco_0666169 [Tanacetum coccineum]